MGFIRFPSFITERDRPKAEVSIPVSQHAGAPAKPIVKVGDTVTVGQMIAEAGGFVSAPVHASVSGKVTKLIAKPNNLGKDVLNIVIENDFENTLCEDVKPRGDLDQLTPDEIKKIIADAGCVGMGGAGFPTHVKLSPGRCPPRPYQDRACKRRGVRAFPHGGPQADARAARDYNLRT